jgi:hypothetical protein
MAMIAAYRAERLSQRPVLRTSLRASRRALRDEREAVTASPDVQDREAEPPQPPSMPEPAQSLSVFANLVSLAEAERQTELPRCEPDAAPVDTGEPSAAAADIPEPAPVDAAAPEPPAAAAPASDPPLADPPLAEIGFGPGMLIRLSQLGLHTTGDLARADAVTLRTALGDISRLVDVETWIAAARQTRTSPAQ